MLQWKFFFGNVSTVQCDTYRHVASATFVAVFPLACRHAHAEQPTSSPTLMWETNTCAFFYAIGGTVTRHQSAIVELLYRGYSWRARVCVNFERNAIRYVYTAHEHAESILSYWCVCLIVVIVTWFQQSRATFFWRPKTRHVTENTHSHTQNTQNNGLQTCDSNVTSDITLHQATTQQRSKCCK